MITQMVECLAGDHTNCRVLGGGTQMVECLAGDHTNGIMFGRNGRVFDRGSHKW